MTLDEIEASIRQHAEGVGSSVVGIGQRWGVGSGIVLAEGRVLTNAHNVRGDQVTVTFADGRTAEGSVAGQRAEVGALARGESVGPPRLGIAIAPRRVARRLRRAVGLPDTEGLLIQQVTEDSPAARADLSSGDLIVAAAGQPVGGVDDLFDALQGAQGGALELRVVRGTDERTVQVVFTPEIEGK
jgi:S1-C subfamily serine protease